MYSQTVQQTGHGDGEGGRSMFEGEAEEVTVQRGKVYSSGGVEV